MAILTARPKVEAESHPPRPRRFTVSEYDAIIEAGILAKRHHIELCDGQILLRPADSQPQRVAKGEISARPDTWRSRPYRFTVDEYMKMAEIGIFVEGERVELMDGEIIQMAPAGPLHGARTSSSLRLFAPLFVDGRAVLRVQDHILLGDNTRPEPDLALLRWRDDLYESRSPTAEDVLLAIEVSVSSLSYDRGRKLARYAESGIPEIWIKNTHARVVEAYANPINGQYTESRTYRSGETITPQAFPDLQLPVSQLIGAPGG